MSDGPVESAACGPCLVPSSRVCRVVACLALVALLSSCGDVEVRFGTVPDRCGPCHRPSIVVSAHDAVTGQPLPIASVSVRQSDGPGAARHRLDRSADDPERDAGNDAWERPALRIEPGGQRAVFEGNGAVGVFQLTIRAVGFLDAVVADVRVDWTSDGCYQAQRTVWLNVGMTRLAES